MEIKNRPKTKEDMPQMAILSIQAGAGSTESWDWAKILMHMYLRWAEGRGYESRALDLSPGEEAGLKRVTVEIEGQYVYEDLKAERGVHRLVWLSPFDSNHLRHTSFALVEVRPADEVSRLKGDHISAEWGSQIRSYVLHPYKLVKDHRTGHQSSDAEGVLDGALDEFINPRCTPAEEA